MKLSFTDIVNKYKNKPCLVIGHGPSLNPHLERLQEYRDKGVLLLSCNNWFDFYDVKPDYWVLANNTDTISKWVSKMNGYKGVTIVYADSIDLTERWWIDKYLQNDYLPYDQRHHYGNPCGPRGACCTRIIPGRLTIQEELMRYANEKTMCTNSDTVAIPMLYFSILLGCNPIYVCGLDTDDYKSGYAKNKVGLMVCKSTHWLPTDRIITSFEWADKCAKNIGVEIINLNENPIFNTFKKGSIKL